MSILINFDVNGKPIFEGSIVKVLHNNWIGVVTWNDTANKFILVDNQNNFLLDPIFESDCEVVNNN